MKAADKKEALKKYGLLHTAGQSKAEILQAMADDLISVDDAQDIYYLLNPVKELPKVTPAPGKELTLADKLKEIDYANLRGDMFKKYCLLLQSLKWNERLVFQRFKVKVVKKIRYRGIKDSPVDIIGIEKESDKPDITTSITVKAALITNGTLVEDEDGQFFEMINTQLSPTNVSHFFLLKK